LPTAKKRRYVKPVSRKVLFFSTLSKKECTLICEGDGAIAARLVFAPQGRQPADAGLRRTSMPFAATLIKAAIPRKYQMYRQLSSSIMGGTAILML
jgi:hypothetical protein